MTSILVSSGNGPVEVRRFVALLVDELARAHAVSSIVAHGDPPRSALVTVDGAAVDGWAGTHALHHPARGKGERARWFAAIHVVAEPEEIPELDPRDVEVVATRSGGPGGQHVNTTASAVIARHRPTGLTVRVEAERSQHQNRRTALRSLGEALVALGLEARASADRDRWRLHHGLVRGAPVAEWTLDPTGHLRRKS